VTFDHENPTPLQLRELDLEAEMMTSGAEAYRSRILKARQRGEAATAGGAASVVKSAIAALSAAVEALVTRAASGVPGRKHVAVRLLNGIDPDLVAFITIASIVNRTIKGSGSDPRPQVQAVAMTIARAIEDEARLAAFAKTEGGLLNHVLHEVESRTSHRKRKRTTLVYLLNKRKDGWAGWSDTECLHLGTRLVDLFIETVGAIERVTIWRGKNKSRLCLQAKPEIEQFIAQRDEEGAVLAPRFMPMVCRPIDWTGPREGGYLGVKVGAVPFVKARPGGRKARLVTPEKAPAVYAAVNAVQATPWRINRWLLGHLQYAWGNEIGESHGILPAQWDKLKIEAHIPPRPADIDTNDEARSRWRREAHAVHLGATKGLAKRLSIGQTLNLAERFQDEEAIYFPHNLDFRGRLYAIPLFLNPQGADPTRAVLEFAEGRPVGEGAWWLAVHGANTFGHDKVSLEERVRWVAEREAQIAKAAEDPWADTWWTKADKPWCFLAWCHEYAGWLREGAGFESRLPIALDGSCNGLQHYSAMLRDPVGGRAVNLVPAPEPSDIYGEVAKVVTNRLEVASEYMTHADDLVPALSRSWLRFGIDRKLTKRAVMVLPYGGTERACRNYVEEAYLKRVSDGERDPFTREERLEALKLLADTVWTSIGEVVVAARAAMDWLRGVSRLMTSAGKDIRWTAPSGFPVLQDYRDIAWRRVKTRLNGAVTFLSMGEETDKLHAQRQANGLPPNFVHSLDAAALCLTVERAVAEGITSFAMIHDSYGTHAADTEKLSRLLREAFVEMYEGNDPLGELDCAVRRVLPEELHVRIPPLPERGELDLRGVLGSDFFFA
jgi:DNA-directed RNA polymerase